MHIFDGFLNTFDQLREYADTATFEDIRNPVDFVVYPKICDQIPADVRREVLDTLSRWKGSPVIAPVMFMRSTPQGTPCPHQVHSDASMGLYSMMLYLNRQADCRGGTSFLSHIDTGIAFNPALDDFAQIVVNDQNDSSKWHARTLVEMIQNRAVIFDSSALHRAEPVGGFGSTPEDSRLVLTCFFS